MGRADRINLVRMQGANASDLKKMVREIKGEAEAEAIAQALEQTNWNRKQAASLLNISYKALIYKSRQYGILRPKAIASEAGGDESGTAGTRPAEWGTDAVLI